MDGTGQSFDPALDTLLLIALMLRLLLLVAVGDSLFVVRGSNAGPNQYERLVSSNVVGIREKK